MWRKIQIQCKYLALLIILGFSFASCSVYNRYRAEWFGKNGLSVKSFDESQIVDNNQTAGDAMLSHNSGISGDITVTVGAGNSSGQEKPLLEHYKELLAQLLEDEKEINQLRENQEAHDMIVNELKAKVEDFKVKLGEVEGKRLDLEEKNNKLVIKYTNEQSALEESAKKYAAEIGKLKVQLVEFQIAEVKAKQELVKIKTQYVMEKKKWAQ
ncbi:MAG: hypothetical protein ACUZ8O_05090 [Candidatus Anammoxibacter sp.]